MTTNASAQAPPIPDARGDVALGNDPDHMFRVEGRSWVAAPGSDRCARAAALGERVVRRQRRLLASHLPAFHARPTMARVGRWAGGPLMRWLSRTMRELSRIERDVARVHDEGCAPESVEALALFAGAYHHVLDELGSIPIPEDIEDEGIGGCPIDRPFQPLDEIARAADEACLALAIAENAFVPAARTCIDRLTNDDPGHYALDEMLPSRAWSPTVAPGPDLALH